MAHIDERLAHIPGNARKAFSAGRKLTLSYGPRAAIVPSTDVKKPSHGLVRITTFVNGKEITREVSARSRRPKDIPLSDTERPLLYHLEDYMHMLSHIAEAAKPDFVPGMDAIDKHQTFASQFYMEFMSRSSTHYRPAAAAALDGKVDLNQFCDSSAYAYQCLRDPEIVTPLKRMINDRRLELDHSLPRQSNILKVFHRKYTTHDLMVQ